MSRDPRTKERTGSGKVRAGRNASEASETWPCCRIIPLLGGIKQGTARAPLGADKERLEGSWNK